MAKLIASGKSGVYPSVDVAGQFNGHWQGKLKRVHAAATVGGLALKANGMLAVAKTGSYHFDGMLSAGRDPCDFDERSGRDAIGDFSTTIGRQLPGKKF